MPANARIQVSFDSSSKTAWIPAGVYPESMPKGRNDETRVDFQSTNSEPLGLEPKVVHSSTPSTRQIYRRIDLFTHAGGFSSFDHFANRR